MMANSVEWVVSDLAAMCEGLVTVPLYVRDSADNVAHVIRDSGAGLCLTDTADRWAEFIRQGGRPADTLQKVWFTHGPSPETAEPLVARIPDEAAGATAVDLVARTSADLATIVYTSGTTGPPKGVMLSHGALIWNARAVAELHPLRPDDVFLSILPLAHSFERSIGWLCPLIGGSEVAFARSSEHLREDLVTISPTIMLAVPRLFDKMRAAALEQAAKSWLGAHLLRATERIGWSRAQAREGTARPPGLAGQVFWWAVGRQVAARFRNAFGSRLRIALNGGAPLAQETARFMAAMETPLIEGYGLTEAGPAVTGARLEDRRFKSAGFPLPGAEVRISPTGELEVRSPGVMMGYWGRPEATARAKDEDGWLKTGDVAEIIDGRVYIRGRIKDLIVLSTGENVNPVPIEAAVLEDALIEQVCVIGDGRPRCAAVVVVHPDGFRGWMREHGLKASTPDSANCRRFLNARLVRRMDAIPPFARTCGVVVETEPWRPESGLVTPTLKTKRSRIEDRYSEQLSEIYRTMSS